MIGLKLAGNMAAVFVGKTVAMAAGLLTFIILARHLGPEALGQYRIVLTVVAFAGLLVDFGLYGVALRELARSPELQARIVGNALSLRLVSSTIAFLLVTGVAWMTPVSPIIKLGLLVMAAGWVAHQGIELLNSVFQERLKQQYMAAVEVVTAAVALAGVYLLSLTDAGPVSMLAATAAGFLTALLVSVILARRLVGFRLGIDLEYWGRLIRAGLPIAGSFALLLLIVRGDLLLLAIFRSPAEVGIYDPGAKIYEMVTKLAFVFGGLLTPILARDLAGAADRYLPRLMGAFSAIAIAMAPGVVLLVFFADEIVVLLVGPEYADSAVPLRILAFAMAAGGTAHVFRFAALAKGRQRQMFKVDTVAAIVAATAYLLLIPTWSYTGAALGRCLADFVILAGAASISLNLAAWRRWLTSGGAILAAALLMTLGLALMGISELHWMVRAILGVLLYSVVLLPMSGLRRGLASLGGESATS